MAIVVYEKPTCTTCRELAQLLAERGIDYEAVEYQVLGLTEDQVRELVAKTGGSAADLLRMREDGARALAGADEDTVVAAMVARPELLQRPVVVNGDRAILARPIERVLEIL